MVELTKVGEEVKILEEIVAGRSYKWTNPKRVYEFNDDIDKTIENLLQPLSGESFYRQKEDYLRTELKKYVEQLQRCGSIEDVSGNLKGNEHQIISQSRIKRLAKSLPLVFGTSILAHVAMDLTYGYKEIGHHISDMWLTHGLGEVIQFTWNNIMYGIRINKIAEQMPEMSIAAFHWWKANAPFFYGLGILGSALGLYKFGKPARALRRIQEHRKEVIPQITKYLINRINKNL